MSIETFLDAIKRDDIPAVQSILSKCPELLENDAPTWVENFLLFAYRYRSFGAAKEIGRRKPELASTKDQHGSTALHVASERGDQSMVKFLVELNPQACLVEDNASMIPLHKAAVKGHGEVIRELVTARPESLEKVTSLQETVLHLVLKNNKCDAFLVLMEEIKKHNQERLLDEKDYEGNNVLLVATYNRQVEIVKLLLPEDSTRYGVMRVNTMNNRGFTALDINNRNPRNTAAKEINRILFANNAREGQPQAVLRTQSVRTQNQKARSPSWSVEKKNVVLVVLVMIAGATFTTACNLSPIITRENYVASSAIYVKGVLSGRLPGVFYVMVFNTAGFIVSMGAVLCLTWSLPCGTVLLFLVVIIFIVYVIILEKSMPKVTVRIGSRNISSSPLLLILVLAIIFSFLVVWGTVKLFFWCFCQVTEWLKQKITI